MDHITSPPPLSNAVQYVIMYAGTPFFAYPWKVLLVTTFGSTYNIAYNHFRRDHTKPLNLTLHFVCLWFQLLSNFALLYLLDSALFSPQENDSRDDNKKPVIAFLGKIKPLRFSTAFLWSYVLHTNSDGCPLIVRLLGIVSVFVAAAFAPLIVPSWATIACANGVIDAMGISAVVLHQPWNSPIFWAIFAIRSILYGYIRGKMHGCLRTYSTPISIAVVGVMIALGMRNDPLRGLVAAGALMIWIISLLIDSPTLFFYGCGFVATLAQGISHEISGQNATLFVFEEENPVNRLQYEWSHLVFFPCIALQSIYESLRETG